MSSAYGGPLPAGAPGSRCNYQYTVIRPTHICLHGATNKLHKMAKQIGFQIILLQYLFIIIQ